MNIAVLTATHKWEPGDDWSSPHVTRLSYYRKDANGGWEVFSPITGWRKTGNDAAWFEKETADGHFKEIAR
jgi:hypothetical protein